MNRTFPLCLLLFVSVVLAPLQAQPQPEAPAAAATAPAAPASDDKSPAATVAKTLATVTGIAISPLLGTGALGAYEYFTSSAETKAKLPWYAQMSFFLPALLLVGAAAVKDSLGAVVPPGLKKPLDVIETLENKATGLVAAGAVVPLTMASLSKMIIASGPAASPLMPSGVAMVHMAALDWSWLLNIATVPLGIAVFVIVWLASHAINVLILLSPWGAIDAVLKTARTAVLGLVTVTATLNPAVAAVLSGVVIIVSYFLAGWSFRLLVFGSVFTWDFLSLRKKRFTPDAAANRVFSGTRLRRVSVPVRTYGRLVRAADGRCEFVYKPWLVLSERTAQVEFAPETHVGRGLFFSSVRDGAGTLLLLPPRYRDHEETFAATYQLQGGVKEAGLLKAWGALRDLFGGAATEAQVTSGG